MANLYVEDLTAKPGFPPRKHDFLGDDGGVISYEFKPSEKKEMATHEAAKFLKHDHFLVTDKDGFQIKPIPKDRGEKEARPTLGGDEIVARYDELTIDALITRVNAMPGGGQAGKAWGKKKLIEFLKDKRESGVKPAAPEASIEDKIFSDGEDDTIGDEMSPEELAELLPGDAPEAA